MPTPAHPNVIKPHQMTKTSHPSSVTSNGLLYGTLITLALLSGCSEDQVESEWSAIRGRFGTTINPDDLPKYSGQAKPSYVQRDNTAGNPIDDAQATLGRVLFYDPQLSIDNSVSCASCHQQQHAFSDLALSSDGVASGKTGRHSMRLINARFGDERRFFWDERAASLEDQVTRPIQDHLEMGFSGVDGRPDFAELVSKLKAVDYYPELFTMAFGDESISEVRMQLALAQFVRSIQSFDSRYDDGRSRVNADNQPFPGFTPQENSGKNLFLAPPQFDQQGVRVGGGAGCAGCHQPPEFSISAGTRNNGIIGRLGLSGTDLTNTRSPSLRDLLDLNGVPHGPMMHDGSLTDIGQVIDHYNAIPDQPGNTNIDPRLRPNGQPQRLNLTLEEKEALISFLKTLTGKSVYTDVRWSDPFQ